MPKTISQYSKEAKIVKETSEYVIVQTSNKIDMYFGHQRGKLPTTKQRKFLVVGGPFAGQYLSRFQLREHDYTDFNSTGGGKHNVIFVADELLND